MSSTLHPLTPKITLQVLTTGIPSPTTPTLIFLHFWGGSSRTFTPLISHLSPTTHTLSLSFPGWGLSTGPASSSAYTITSLATTIKSLIEKLDIKDFVLVGHSMGGKVAQLIAGRESPLGLKGVVLIAPAPPTPLELPEDMRKQQIEAYESPESAEFVVRNVLTAKVLGDEVVKGLVEDMMRGNEWAKRAWPDYGMGEDILEDVEGIRLPVLIIAGELDRVETVERVRREVLGNLKGEKDMVVIEKVGHLLPLEAPERAAGLIEGFVEKVVEAQAERPA